MVDQSMKQVACEDKAPAKTGLGAVLWALVTRPESTAVMLLILLAAFLGLRTNSFLTYENIVWVAHSFAFVAIAGMGILLVISSGNIDLSVGAQMGLAAEVAGWIVYHRPGTPDAFVFLAAIGSGMAFGLVNSVLVVKAKLNPFIATLATGYIGRGMVVIVSENRTFQGFSPTLLHMGQGSVLGLPILVWIMLSLTVFWSFILTQTAYGRYLFAVGGNESTARLSGVPVTRIRMSAYILSGMMGALAGFLLVCRLGVAQQSLGSGYEMDIIAGAIIGGVSMAGGIGTIPGVVIGAGVMAVLRNGLVLLKIGAMWQQLVTGLVVVMAVVFDRMRARSS